MLPYHDIIATLDTPPLSPAVFLFDDVYVFDVIDAAAFAMLSVGFRFSRFQRLSRLPLCLHLIIFADAG